MPILLRDKKMLSKNSETKQRQEKKLNSKVVNSEGDGQIEERVREGESQNRTTRDESDTKTWRVKEKQ